MSNSEKAKQSPPARRGPAAGQRRKAAALALGMLITTGGCIGIYLAVTHAGSDNPGDEHKVARVRRGELVVSVTESGKIAAEKRTVIANELEWPVIIKSVVENGTLVSQGEEIIEFECKALLDEIEEEELDVETARLSYKQAAESYELKKKEMANKVTQAQNALLEAKEDLSQYKDTGGQWEIEKNDAESEIQLARQKLKLAQEKLEFKERVNKDPELNSPYSSNEIEADRLEVQRLELALEKAVANKKMLVKYDHPRQLRRLGAAVEEAQLDLQRAKLEAETQLSLDEAEVRNKKQRLERNENKLKELYQDREQLTIEAEKDGLVVYDTGGSRWRPSDVEVEVGQEIRPRQQLMIIPDMTTLHVETKVFEAVVNQIRASPTGQNATPAIIRLDVNRDKPLNGYVKWVAPIPETQNRFGDTGANTFKVEVATDQLPEGIKPGMTVEVELILTRLKNVLTVPVAAVFTEQDKTYCWKLDDGQAEKIPVTIGRSNDRRVQIKSGLSAGDKVLLVPPESAPQAPDMVTAEKQPPETKRPAPPQKPSRTGPSPNRRTPR